MSESILIKDGTVVTMDVENSVVYGDVLIRDGRVAEIGKTIADR
jgi:dihydroorotase-like cyclic amidohydrolase